MPNNKDSVTSLENDTLRKKGLDKKVPNSPKEQRKKFRKSGSFQVDLPQPDIELEDGLVSQLSVIDVLTNCVTSDKNQLLHRCYRDVTFNPVWLAYHSLQKGKNEKNNSVLITRLLVALDKFSSSSSSISTNHNCFNFQHFQHHVLKTLSNESINYEEIVFTCWQLSKSQYLTPPFIDECEAVVPVVKIEPIFWLFSIFCRLMVPSFYPPSIDYEEAELLMRKLMACLGVAWSHSDQSADDNSSTCVEDYTSSSLLLVSFQQLLSITTDMVGSHVIQSPQFHRAIKCLCLMEFCDVPKTGYVEVRKRGEMWKRRWCVLRRSKLIFFTSSHLSVIKDQIELKQSMNVESLPATHERKYHFRLVEKDGDLKITRELDLLVLCERECYAWVNIIDITLKLLRTGMTPKSSEVVERRLERFRRRLSSREVERKRREAQRAHQTLISIRQEREEIRELIEACEMRRKIRTQMLKKMDQMFDRLHQISCKHRKEKKIKNEDLLLRFQSSHSDDVTTVCRLIQSQTADSAEEDAQERRSIKQQIEELKISIQNVESSKSPFSLREVDSCYDTRTTSSSDNLSLSSLDASLIPPSSNTSKLGSTV